MHAHLLWLLVGLAAVGVAAWRVRAALGRAKEMRASREAAMAIALAEAQRAASESLARKRVEPQAKPPAITRTIDRTAARPSAPAPATARAPAPAPATPVPSSARAPAEVAARIEAQRIALDAARRAKAQKLARVEAEHRAAQAARAARAKAAPVVPVPPTPAAPAPVASKAPPAVTRLVAPAPAPAAQVRPPTPVPPPAPVLVKTPAETLIMLADDSKMVRVKTSRLLEGRAYRVVTAVDGLDAVRQLETCRPDLVITDVDMPGMDGFGLARHLRGNASTAHIPIVMITSAEDRHRDDALREGVGLVLGKPYPEDQLLAHIQSFKFVAGARA